MRTADGGLGTVIAKERQSSLLDDYALIWGLLELYETTFHSYLKQTSNLILRPAPLTDEENGVLSASGNQDLLLCQKESYDGAIFRNSVMMLNLIRLARFSRSV